MADALSSHRLYSQTSHDERGNFAYVGDRHRAGTPLPALTASIHRHLENVIGGSGFAVRGETFAGGRKVTVELLDLPIDLSDDEARRSFEVSTQDQIERFGFTRSNIYQDFMNCDFYSEVRIDRAYWAALATRRGAGNTVEARVPLAAFKRTLGIGDTLKLIAAPAGHLAIGTTRKIIAVRSKDLVLEGPSYLSFPRSSAFACDGSLVRISIGDQRTPDAHLLYEWTRAAALPATA